MGQVVITHITRDVLLTNWSFVRDHIERACAASGAEMTGDDVYRMALLGQMFVFAISESGRVVGVAVCEINQQPQKRFLRIVFLAGKGMSRWIGDLRDELARRGRAIGAVAIEAECRTGFVRALKSHGAKVKRVVMQVEI